MLFFCRKKSTKKWLKLFFPEIFSQKVKKNFSNFFFSIFFFVLTDHFNSKYMFYDSFGLNSRKKIFISSKKFFRKNLRGGGILIMPQIVDFLQWRWYFGRKWPNRPNYFFSATSDHLLSPQFFFQNWLNSCWGMSFKSLKIKK